MTQSKSHPIYSSCASFFSYLQKNLGAGNLISLVERWVTLWNDGVYETNGIRREAFPKWILRTACFLLKWVSSLNSLKELSVSLVVKRMSCRNANPVVETQSGHLGQFVKTKQGTYVEQRFRCLKLMTTYSSAILLRRSKQPGRQSEHVSCINIQVGLTRQTK